jgi:hypothetical protein
MDYRLRNAKATFEDCCFADNIAPSLIYVSTEARPATSTNCSIAHPNTKTTSYITFQNTVTAGFTPYDTSEPCFTSPIATALRHGRRLYFEMRLSIQKEK